MNGNENERFERKFKEPGADWEPVAESDARRILANNYNDVDLMVDIMRHNPGDPIPTMFALYRIVVGD